MHHKPMDFEELDRLFRYTPEAGGIFEVISTDIYTCMHKGFNA